MKEFKNQILVTDKVFITPEFKLKRKAYKWHFILSVFLVCCLFSYYIYAEYDKVKGEEVSKTLLATINFENQDPEEDTDVIDTTIRTKDNVIIVILDPSDPIPTDEVNIDDLTQSDFTSSNKNSGSSNSSTKPNKSIFDESIHTARDGTEYTTVAKIDIPKIDVHYPVIAPVDRNLLDYTGILKDAPCYYSGPEPNEVGNYCIVGHNYRNNKFFSKIPNMELGDTIQLTDASGRTINYRLYDKYIVNPENQACTDQETHGKKEVTLITCTNDSKQRWILKFEEM